VVFINDTTTKSRPRAREYTRLAKSGQCPEQELSDLEARTWFAVFLPRGASEPIIRKLNQATFRNRDTLSCRNV
jgi:hypothetical protein